jgi:hypothetical protein
MITCINLWRKVGISNLSNWLVIKIGAVATAGWFHFDFFFAILMH